MIQQIIAIADLELEHINPVFVEKHETPEDFVRRNYNIPCRLEHFRYRHNKGIWFFTFRDKPFHKCTGREIPLEE